MINISHRSSNKPDKEQKKAQKTSQDLATSKDATKAPKVQNPCSAMVLKTSKENTKGKDSNKHKTIQGKHPQPSLHKKVIVQTLLHVLRYKVFNLMRLLQFQAKTPKSGLVVPSNLKPQRGAVSNRSLLNFDKRYNSKFSLHSVWKTFL